MEKIKQFNNIVNEINNLKLDDLDINKMAINLYKNKELFLNLVKNLKIKIKDEELDKYIRKITTIFLIKYHSDNVFGNTGNKEKELLVLANKIHEELTTNIKKKQYPKLLKIHIRRFVTLFDKWVEIDKILMLKELGILYQQTKKLIGESDDIVKESLKKQLSSYEKNALMIDKNGINYIKNYKTAKLKEENKDSVEKIMKQAFWDGFIEDIELRKFDRLEATLKEIRDKICNLVPNRKDYHNNFDENFDIPFIIQMVGDDVMNGETVGKYINYLLDTIKDLEAPVDNEETENIRNRIVEMFGNYETSEILAYLFQSVYDKIDNIIKRFKELKEFMDQVNK